MRSHSKQYSNSHLEDLDILSVHLCSEFHIAPGSGSRLCNLYGYRLSHACTDSVVRDHFEIFELKINEYFTLVRYNIPVLFYGPHYKLPCNPRIHPYKHQHLGPAHIRIRIK